MKKTLYLTIFLFSILAQSQVLGGSMLSLGTKTTAEMNAITVAQGKQIGSYVDNSDTGTLHRWNGTAWIDTGSGGSTSLANGTNTTVTGDGSIGSPYQVNVATPNLSQVLAQGNTANENIILNGSNVLTQANVVNNLTSTSTVSPLGAGQGKILQDQIDALGSGSGDVTAANPFGQNEKVIVSDGTVKGVKSTPVDIDATGNISGAVSINFTGFLSGSNELRLTPDDAVGSSAGKNSYGFKTGNRAYLKKVDESVGLQLNFNALTADRTITFPDADVDLSSGLTDDQTAAEVPVNTSAFTGNLSTADDNVLKALNTIDDLVIGGSQISVTSTSGWADYVDTQYTSASPFALAEVDGTVTLPNNAGTVVDFEKPTDIATFYNSANQTLTGLNGDAYVLDIEFKVRPTSAASDIRLQVSIDIGGAVNEIYKRNFSLTKGSGVEHYYLSSFLYYTLNTFQANGGAVKISTDNGPVEIYDIRYVISRQHKAGNEFIQSNSMTSDDYAAIVNANAPDATNYFATLNDLIADDQTATEVPTNITGGVTEANVQLELQKINANNFVTTAKIADNSINSAKIIDGTVTEADIANSTILLNDLNATGAPTNGYYFTVNSAGGNIAYVPPPSGVDSGQGNVLGEYTTSDERVSYTNNNVTNAGAATGKRLFNRHVNDTVDIGAITTKLVPFRIQSTKDSVIVERPSDAYFITFDSIVKGSDYISVRKKDAAFLTYLKDSASIKLYQFDVANYGVGNYAVESLGPELVTSGDFSSSTGWSLQNGSTISGGAAQIIANGALNATGSNHSLHQATFASNLDVTKNYRFTFDARQVTGTGNFQISVGFGIIFNQAITSTLETYTFDVTLTPSGSGNLSRLAIGGATVSNQFELTNISVKEILP